MDRLGAAVATQPRIRLRHGTRAMRLLGDARRATGVATEAGEELAAGAAGRSGLCNGTGVPPHLARGPFYVFPSHTALLATHCGLAAATDGAVLAAAGGAIPGLFAAGEATGGFHGHGYMTGSALGKAGVFGLAAGEAAARFALSAASSAG